jgi:hypothetical protein
MTAPAASWTAFEAAIYNWLVPAFVPTAIFEGQSVPQPAFPYASIMVTGDTREGGRDAVTSATDLTRAQSVRVTPTVLPSVTYTITIGSTPYSYTASSSPTASEITAGLKTALPAAPQTVTDNHGTLDIAGTTVFLLTVSANLTWANRDVGHEVVQTNYGSRRVPCLIKFHADEPTVIGIPGGSMAWAEAVQGSLSQQSVIDALYAASVAIVKTNGIHMVPTMLNGQWVSRAVLDVVFRTVFTPAEDVGYIKTFTATGDVGGNTVVVNGGA